MKTYNLTLNEAVGEELAKEVQEVIGTEHAEELAEIEPAYNWVATLGVFLCSLSVNILTVCQYSDVL